MSDVTSLITAYPASGAGARSAVLVLPGGGYGMLADHEGHDYARWLSALGLHAFVLRYPVAPARHPEPVTVATAAIAYVRSGDHDLEVDRYPVISFLDEAHEGSVENLLGPDSTMPAGWTRSCEDWLRRGGWTGPREGTSA